MEIKLVLLDLDDTLIDTQPLYVRRCEMLAAYLQGFGFGYQEVLELRRKIDNELVKEHGVKKSRFPDSFAKTYRQLCENSTTYNPRVESYCRGLAYGVYEDTSDPHDYIWDILEFLDSNYDTAIITAGELEIQLMRCVEADVLQYFSQVFVVPKKTPDLFERVCNFYGVSTDETVMIGNSLNSDILPALEAGLFGIYTPNGTFEIDGVVNTPPGDNDKFFAGHDLRSVPNILNKIKDER